MCRRLRRAPLLAAFGHALDIAACAESPAGAGQDDHPYGRVAGEPRQPAEQPLHNRRRQRVHPLRPVEGQRRDASVDGLDQVAHELSLGWYRWVIGQSASPNYVGRTKIAHLPAKRLLLRREIISMTVSSTMLPRTVRTNMDFKFKLAIFGSSGIRLI